MTARESTPVNTSKNDLRWLLVWVALLCVSGVESFGVEPTDAEILAEFQGHAKTWMAVRVGDAEFGTHYTHDVFRFRKVMDSIGQRRLRAAGPELLHVFNNVPARESFTSEFAARALGGIRDERAGRDG
jgi:hypothetical protein